MSDLKCYHCGDECPDESIKLDEKIFCCTGCKTVFEILNENNLCQYYDIEKNPGLSPKIQDFKNKYAFLDNPTIQSQLLTFNSENVAKITFSIPKMHCSSCIWLLENLRKLHKGVIASEVNFLKKECFVTFNPTAISLRQLVELMSSIGYAPQISLNDLEKKAVSPNRRLIYHLGVAGFCFGNIMLFSFPEYFSLDVETEGEFAKIFRYLNFLIALPVVFYSASDYFISAYKGLKHKIINIDFPLSLGILVMFLRSSYEIFSNTGPGYMDALAGLVFFLLVGKWFQNKTYEALSFERDYKSYFPIAVTKLVNGEECTVPVSQIQIGDRIVIRNQELVPADSILLKGDAMIDYSFVTGESEAIEKKSGDLIYAGGRQTAGIIELEVRKNVSQSYLTQLWNQDIFSKQNIINLNTRVNVVSKYFTIVILSISLLTALYWYFVNPKLILNTFTAILIITCPCALALTLPFTFGNALRILGRNKLYLKNSDTIENISKIDTIVFDKTGTITHGNNSNVVFHGQLTDQEASAVKTLVKHSTHPLSKRIYQSLTATKSNQEVKHYQEIPGKGIQGIVGNDEIKIGAKNFVGADTENTLNATSVFVAINGQIKGYYLFTNSYRKEFATIAEKLEKMGYELHLLSGDNDKEKDNLLPFFKNESRLHFNQTPADKLAYIQKLQAEGKKVMMIGDGLNDAGALKQSNVGIAITEDIHSFFPACDAILDASEFGQIDKFIQHCKDSMKTIRYSFAISLLYNTIGLSFAITGSLKPVIAAILMPISSITVITFVTIMTNFFGNKQGLLKQ